MLILPRVWVSCSGLRFVVLFAAVERKLLSCASAAESAKKVGARLRSLTALLFTAEALLVLYRGLGPCIILSLFRPGNLPINGGETKAPALGRKRLSLTLPLWCGPGIPHHNL